MTKQLAYSGSPGSLKAGGEGGEDFYIVQRGKRPDLLEAREGREAQ
jgi:hypothetical protein